jgi:hypothetical protein
MKKTVFPFIVMAIVIFGCNSNDRSTNAADNTTSSSGETLEESKHIR